MGLTRTEIRDAVKENDWQELRQSLKKTSTKEKLKRLHDYLVDPYSNSSRHSKDIQVLNYLNALARGGQIMPVEQARGSHLENLFRQKSITIVS